MEPHSYWLTSSSQYLQTQVLGNYLYLGPGKGSTLLHLGIWHLGPGELRLIHPSKHSKMRWTNKILGAMEYWRSHINPIFLQKSHLLHLLYSVIHSLALHITHLLSYSSPSSDLSLTQLHLLITHFLTYSTVSLESEDELIFLHALITTLFYPKLTNHTVRFHLFYTKAHLSYWSYCNCSPILLCSLECEGDDSIIRGYWPNIQIQVVISVL